MTTPEPKIARLGSPVDPADENFNKPIGALASDSGNSIFAIVKARSRDVNVPVTAGASMLLALQGSSTFFDLDISNWSGRSSRTVDALQVSSWLVGVPQTVVETTTGITIDRARVGTVRLVSNEPGNDPDLDGLSNEVEALVQTCTGAGGSTCQGAWNFPPDDSDNDGLSDGEELLGVIVGGEEIDFPGWGAHPLHKDAFVEVDFDDRLLDCSVSRTTADEMNHLAATFAGSVQATATRIDEMYSAGTVDELRNPDNATGLRVHLDVGFSPADSVYGSLYGAWSDFDGRMVREVYPITFTASSQSGDRLVVAYNHPDPTRDEEVTIPVGARTPSQLSAYAQLAVVLNPTLFPVEFVEETADGAGVMPRWIGTEPCSGDSRLEMHIEDAAGNVRQGLVTVHDSDTGRRRDWAFDHHYAFSPNRDARFRYVLVSNGGGGQNGGLDSWVGDFGGATTGHELGHSFRLAHSGFGQITPGDLNCAPHYESQMSYAYVYRNDLNFYQGALFSMNPATTSEAWSSLWTWMSKLAGAPFSHLVSAGSYIDWNRDGGFSTGTWRVPLTQALGGTACRSLSQERNRISSSSNHTPTTNTQIVRAGQYLIAMWGAHDSSSPPRSVIQYRIGSLTQVASGLWGCSDQAVYSGPEGCVTWTCDSCTVPLGGTFDVHSFDAYEHSGKLFVAWRDKATNTALVARYTYGATGLAKVGSNVLLGFSPTTPTLTRLNYHSGTSHTSKLAAFVLSTASPAVLRRAEFNDATSTWTSLVNAVDGAGSSLTTAHRPAFVQHPLENDPLASMSTRRTCMALPSVDLGSERTAVQFWCQNSTGASWENISNQVYDPPAAAPNPACGAGLTNVAATGLCMAETRGSQIDLEFRPVRRADYTWLSPGLGHWLLFTRDSEQATVAHQSRPLTSSVLPWSPPAGSRLFSGWHFLPDDQWENMFPESGTDYTYDANIVGGFALVGRHSRDGDGVWFYPYADGTFSYPIRQVNDFRVIQDFVCGVAACDAWVNYQTDPSINVED